MSDTDTDPDSETDAPDADRPDVEETDADLDADDYAEIPEQVAEQVAADTTADAEDGEDADTATDTDSEESADAEDGDKDPLTTGTTVGDLYCNALGMSATYAKDAKGSGVSDFESEMDEYADFARQLELDAFVNEWFKQFSGSDELTPGQGIVVGTSMFAMGVMMDDGDLAETMYEEVTADE